MTYNVFGGRGAITAEKFRGTKVWVSTPGCLRPAPGQRPDWVLGAGRGHPFPLWGSGGITRGKFVKTQMLYPAFWPDSLLWNCLLFENYGQEVWGHQYTLVPQLKSWGYQSPPFPMVVAPMFGGTLNLALLHSANFCQTLWSLAYHFCYDANLQEDADASWNEPHYKFVMQIR